VRREQSGEPLLVELTVHTRRLTLCRGPEFACLRALPPGCQATRIEQAPDELLEARGSRELEARLPVLERLDANPHPRRQVSLD
jgi:hypothetical protein